MQKALTPAHQLQTLIYVLCSQVEEKIKQTHRKYLLQEQLKIIKKVQQEHICVVRAGLCILIF